VGLTRGELGVVHEVLLGPLPVVQVVLPGSLGERLDVELVVGALSLGELAFRRAPRPGRADRAIVLGAELAPKGLSASRRGVAPPEQREPNECRGARNCD